MSRSNSRLGRPNVFGKVHRRHVVAVARQHGYTHGQELLQAEGGIYSTISIPTMIRFVEDHNAQVRETGKGKVIEFKRGRRVA